MKVLQFSQLPMARSQVNRCLYQLTRSASSSQHDQYQFLHKSNMNTYYFQKSLPRLPIPKAEKTLERYLVAQRPISTDEEYKITEGHCNRFMKSGTKGQFLILKWGDNILRYFRRMGDASDA